MKIFASTLLLILSISLAHSQEVKYYIKTDVSKKVAGTTTHTLKYPNLEANEWVIYTTIAPNLPSQSGMKTIMTPVGKGTDELSVEGRKVLFARVTPKDKNSKTDLTVNVTHEGTLHSRHLMPAPADKKLPNVPELTANEKKHYLRDNELHNFTSDDFKKWLKAKKLEKGKTESDLDYARKVFLEIKSTFKYEYTSSMNRIATNVCRDGKSDCGGMSILFVSACRSQGIPARTQFGRWALSSNGEKLGDSEYHQWHVKAEFYVKGIGWIPVDPSSGVLHDKTKEGLQYFGHDPGDFVTFHIDDDLLLDTFHFGKQKVAFMQGPQWWVSGKGNLNNGVIKESWTIKELK